MRATFIPVVRIPVVREWLSVRLSERDLRRFDRRGLEDIGLGPCDVCGREEAEPSPAARRPSAWTRTGRRADGV